MSDGDDMFRKTRKVARYVASSPSKMLGINQIRQTNRMVLEQYRSLKAPICPHCYQAIMWLDESQNGIRRTFEDNSSIDLYHWICQNPTCKADEFLPADMHLAKEWAKAMHNETAFEQVQQMDEADIEPYLKTHRVFSRVLYLAALLCILFMLYNIIFSESAAFKSLVIYIPVTTAFFVSGMKRSYRHWQLKNRRLFDDKNFKEWFHSGQWFV